MHDHVIWNVENEIQDLKDLLKTWFSVDYGYVYGNLTRCDQTQSKLLILLRKARVQHILAGSDARNKI